MNSLELKKEESKRKSNIELLRIISMVLIIMHHYAIYSKFAFQNKMIVNKVIVNIFSSFGQLGVTLFIIISGYFYDKSEVNMKKILKLVSKVWVYSIIGLCIGLVTKSSDINLLNVLKSVIPIVFGQYWFVGCYILIYIFSPFFKLIIDQTDKKYLEKYLILMAIIWNGIAIIPNTQTFVNLFINLGLVYLIGGYIKKYDLAKISNKKRIMWIVVIMILMVCITTGLQLKPIRFKYFKIDYSHFNSTRSPFILILTILVFNCFRKINIKDNKIINKIAGTTFGIYLIHENIFLREIIWRKIIRGAQYSNSPFLIFNAVIGVVVVFVVCSLIDIIEQKTIQKMIYEVIDK